MGGQQPVPAVSSEWSKRLFSEDKISGMKTQDEKLRELQNEFKDFCRKVESSLSEFEEKISHMSTDLVLVKALCESKLKTNDTPQTSTQIVNKGPKEILNEQGYLLMSDLQNHIKKLMENKTITCNPDVLSMGWINNIAKMLELVKPQGSDGKSTNVMPTKFGITSGYVKWGKSTTKRNMQCFYHREKFVALCMSISKDPFACFSEFREMKKKFDERGVVE